MTCEHLYGAIALVQNLSDGERRVLFAIGCDQLSPDEILDRVLPDDGTEPLYSLIERGIVGLAEPELFKITEPAAWAENPVLDTIERIVEARRRAADPDGCEGPVLLPFTRRIPARSKARASKKTL
jgi:hypothetical protein